jgi:hypothetical protein
MGSAFDSAVEISSSNYANPGNYSVVIRAFALHTNLNASAVLNIAITTSVDLVASSLFLSPSSPMEGRMAEFHATVLNLSPIPVIDVQTRFILNSTAFSNRTIDSIQPGENITVSARWDNVSRGTQNLTFVIDPDNRIAEASKFNNVRNVTFRTEAGTFSVSVQIEGLGQGAASLYVNGTEQLSVSGTWSRDFEVGKAVTITLAENVTAGKNVVYTTDEYYWPGINSTTAFVVHYYPIFYVTVSSAPTGLVSFGGWRRKGANMELTAPQKEDITGSTQLRFDHWLIGTNQISSLLWSPTVNGPLNITAIYVYFFRVGLSSQFDVGFTVNTILGYCDEYWCRNGTQATWNLSVNELNAPGIEGQFRLKYIANATFGKITVTGPTTIPIEWRRDNLSEILGVVVQLGIPAMLVSLIVYLVNRRRKRR